MAGIREGDGDVRKIFTCALVKFNFDLRQGRVVSLLSNKDRRHTPSDMTVIGRPLGKKTCTQTHTNTLILLITCLA